MERAFWSFEYSEPVYVVNLHNLDRLKIISTEKYNPQSIFTWADAAVMLMTFLQSFAVLGKFYK